MLARTPRLPGWLFTTPWGLGIGAFSYAALTALLAPVLGDAHLLDAALLYLLLTLVVSAAWGYAVGISGAIAADLLVNFFFVRPLHTFTVQEPANVVALIVFLAVAALGSLMLSLLRRQARIAVAREAETEVLLSLSREVAAAVSPRDAMDGVCRALVRSLRVRGASIVHQGTAWEVLGSSGSPLALQREEEVVAREALRSGEVVRLGGRASVRGKQRSAQPVAFVPFGHAGGTRGVLCVYGTISVPAFADEGRLLRAFADEAGRAMHRSLLELEARRAEVLQRADELKTTILSSVSHDLRSPLTAIKAAVGSLRDDSIAWAPGDRESFLATIESQTDRLTGTVTNLLEMSRLEGRAVEPRFEPVEVAPLLAEVRLMALPATVGREVRIEPCEGLWARADYGLLVQALGNVIENAAHYSRPGGAITLAARADGRRIELLVRDEGPGIGAVDLPHVFEKFYRGGHEGGKKGTGLGLSIVKAMIELCEGSVSVRSDAEGTEFRLALASAAAPRG